MTYEPPPLQFQWLHNTPWFSWKMFKREKESPIATGWNGGSTSDRTTVHPQIALGIPTDKGAAVTKWLLVSSWLAEQKDRGSITGLVTWIFRDWLSPASKSRYGWKIAKSTLILKTTNQSYWQCQLIWLLTNFEIRRNNVSKEVLALTLCSGYCSNVVQQWQCTAIICTLL